MKFLWKLRALLGAQFVPLSFMSGPDGLIKSGSLIFDAAI